jgi:hypothetical protein
MRRFALSTLFGIALLDCFLAYSGTYLSAQVRQHLTDKGAELPNLSMIALAVSPWFYLLAAFAVVSALVGLSRKLGDQGLVYAAVGLLFLDILALLVMLWGVGVIFFPFGERINMHA